MDNSSLKYRNWLLNEPKKDGFSSLNVTKEWHSRWLKMKWIVREGAWMGREGEGFDSYTQYSALRYVT